MIRRSLIALSLLIAVVIAFAVLTDWHWLRGPVENYMAKKLGRPVTLQHFALHLRPTTDVHFDGLHIDNAPGFSQRPLADVASVETDIDLLAVFSKAPWLHAITIRGGDVSLERLADEKANWTLPTQPNSGAFHMPAIGELTIDQSEVRYDDAHMGLLVNVKAKTAAPAPSARYTLNFILSGNYRGAVFNGTLDSGGLPDAKNDSKKIPLRFVLDAGPTKASAEGAIGDLTFRDVDANVKISGPTLANLYPFLLLPLPASPPYSLAGHLTRADNTFGLADIVGKIGDTDVSGRGTYEIRAPRPLLKAYLHSNDLSFSDLGPLIGAHGKPGEDPAAPAAARDPKAGATPNAREFATREQAIDTEDARDPNRKVLPHVPLGRERLKLIDADATLDADHIHMVHPFGFESISAKVNLRDGILQLEPLDFGFAGGKLHTTLVMNGQNEPLHSHAKLTLTGARIDRLFPTSPAMLKSVGKFGVNIELDGPGDSVADWLANSNGTASLASSGGELSALLMREVDLDGAGIMRYMFGGDQNTPLRCAATSFDVKNGVATSQFLVLDTEDTRIDGTGDFDLRQEHLNFVFHQQPKNKSILALRAPININGTFRHADWHIDKGVLAARAGGAVLLGLINPLAALIPLVETGPGEDAPCHQLLESTGAAAANEKKSGTPPVTTKHS